MYLTQFKHANKGWAAFAQDLKVQANKAFPQLHNDANEQPVLGHYLATKCPQTHNNILPATMGLESYLMASSGLEQSASTE